MPLDSNRSDDKLRRMAALYAQREGERLLLEAAELEAGGASVSPRMDRKVRAAVGAGRRNRFFRAGALAAACLALVLLVPWALRRSGADLSGSTVAPQAAAEQAAMEEAVEEEPVEVQEEAMATDEAEMDAAPQESARDSGISGAEVIPLAFELPEGFAVAGVEQDNAQSVYYLENAMLDDVVMTLEYAPEPHEFDGLAAIDIGGEGAWGRSGDGYSLLSLERDNILYVLTCRYDINTLAALGRAIVGGR